ncbi:MAG: hypothetical protein M3515_01495 [Actinomycetota bacterium]|jgi:hypothetical protein|nr:hypothetical protein [Actinomycetota bacterium]MDQ3318927.1 hypothetical protein [Actinomycetota bacterium]
MAGTLKKPKTQAHRSSLYLNADEVSNSLAAFEGGDVEEVLTRVAEETGGGLEGGIDAKVVKGKGGRNRSRRLEEDVKRKRTEHSAASLLLEKLHEEDAIGIIEGAYGPGLYQELDEQMLLQFRGELRIHPLHQVVSAARGFLAAASSYGASRDEIREMKQTVDLLELMAQPGPGERRAFLAYAETPETHDGYKLVLPIQERHLRVPLEDFSGTATFIAQVDRVIPDGEEVLAIRLLRNAPPLGLERQALDEALPDLIEGFRELGVEVSQADFFLTNPAVVLKPIWIFK